MSERETSIDRMIFSPEILPEQRKNLTEFFQDPSMSIELEGLQEEEKTERQIQILDRVDQELNNLRRDFGLDEFHVSNSKVHIIPRDLWTHEESAHFDPATQSTYFRHPDTDLIFADHAFHEQLHQHTYGAMEVLPGQEAPQIHYYRMGLEIYSRPDHHRHFELLNEAVTATLEKSFIMKMRQLPEFADDVEESDRILAAYKPKMLAGGLKTGLDDIYQLWLETKDGQRIRFDEWNELRDRMPDQTKIGIQVRSVSYDLERRALSTLLRKIADRTDMKDEQTIFSEFSKAALTGNVLGIGKLLDRVFGQGTYRGLGEQADEKSFSEFIDSL